MPTNEQKYTTVIDRNTFYFFDVEFEEDCQAKHIDPINNLLYNLHAKIKQTGIRREYFEELLLHPNGLRAILALNGLSHENLMRILTVARIIDDRDLNQLLCRSQWAETEKQPEIHEWSKSKVTRLALDNEHFRRGLVNLFFEGASNPALTRILRPFELKKLSIHKLAIDVAAMIDTLVRYREKGSAQARGKNNAEMLIRKTLGELALPYDSGDLPLLVEHAPGEKRTMDFIIPDKNEPKVIVESSFLSTTSSGQGDKAKTEKAVSQLIRRHYPQAKFIGFVDGIGWYVRKEDLKRMVSAYDDVFTFREDELARFETMLIEVFNL